MRPVIVAALLVIALALTGCISSQTVVKLKADGSGTIVETTTMSSQMVSMMKEMMTGMAKELGGKDVSDKDTASADLFSEKDARAKTSKLGEGVTFVSSEKIKTSDSEGLRAIYHFADINRLRISEKPSTPGPGGARAESSSEGEEVTFRFARQGGDSVLTIINPPSTAQKTSTDTPPQGPKPQAGGPEMEQFTRLMKGLRISRALEIEGRLKKTNATYVEGNTVTLLDINFEALLSNEGALALLSTTKNPDDAKRILKDIKGIKVELSPEVKIEFAAR